MVVTWKMRKIELLPSPKGLFCTENFALVQNVMSLYNSGVVGNYCFVRHTTVRNKLSLCKIDCVSLQEKMYLTVEQIVSYCETNSFML